jgi:hypothetical protein
MVDIARLGMFVAGPIAVAAAQLLGELPNFRAAQVIEEVNPGVGIVHRLAAHDRAAQDIGGFVVGGDDYIDAGQVVAAKDGFAVTIGFLEAIGADDRQAQLAKAVEQGQALGEKEGDAEDAVDRIIEVEGADQAPGEVANAKADGDQGDGPSDPRGGASVPEPQEGQGKYGQDDRQILPGARRCPGGLGGLPVTR